ncbi:3'-5' exonuclease [Marinobacter goseongensis]|uniref:3'-5' exonuclease n=1 Tax=Marinobacter goseongensis TaxID=453838 RepID=UPI0020050F03|nr:3'-5' exonuclease [Marinobacter goseongensis]MCK7552888.1 exonuclease domain-containing protein [Marinobacter goseongensis]
MRDETILVVDLEATCWEDQTTPAGDAQSVNNMEIIEVGCALATRKGSLLDARSFLVRPIRNPELSSFCSELTGITQSMVDAAPTFPEAIAAMDDWLGDLPDDFIWCSWGNYDRLHLPAGRGAASYSGSPSPEPETNLATHYRPEEKERSGQRFGFS